MREIPAELVPQGYSVWHTAVLVYTVMTSHRPSPGSSTASVISHLGEIKKSQKDLRRDIAKVASEVSSFNVLLTSLRGTGDAIAAAQISLSALPPVGGSGVTAMPPLTFTSESEAPSDDESEVCSDDESEGWPPSSQSMM